MLSHILAFSPKDVRDTVDVCERIYHRLKDNKFKVYPDYFVAIGLLCLLDDDEDELVDDMIEMAMLLKGEKKYKWLGKGMNLLMASASSAVNLLIAMRIVQLWRQHLVYR